eukprot:37897-Chlamydomonas_euryale.AAC.14
MHKCDAAAAVAAQLRLQVLAAAQGLQRPSGTAAPNPTGRCTAGTCHTAVTVCSFGVAAHFLLRRAVA